MNTLAENLAEMAPSQPAADALAEALVFVARYFGRNAEAAQLTGGVPLPQGRLTGRELAECAARAGLSLTSRASSADQVKASWLPAIVEHSDGSATVVLDRQDDKFECVDPASLQKSWLPLTVPDAGATWHFLKPVFHFDSRSLLYFVREPRRWFWDTFRMNRGIYGWALLATVFVNLIGLVLPFYSMAVYDRVVPNNAEESLWVLTTAAIAVSLFDLLLRFLRGYFLEAAARRSDISLSSRVFAQSLRLRAASRPASGGVLANSVRDFDAVREFFASTTLTVIGDLPFMLLYLAVIAAIGGWLVLVPITGVLLAMLAALLMRKRLARVVDRLTRKNSQRTAHLFEVMNGIDTVKALGAEAWARQRWEVQCAAIAEDNLQARELSTFASHLSTALFALDTVFIVMFGALMIGAKQLTLGQLIAVSMLGSRAIAPAGQWVALVMRWYQTRASLEALEKIMTAPTDDRPGGLFVSSLRGEVEFRDVNFAYPQRAAPALQGANLRIAAGERVAFIGRLGSGKSTALRLLLNLYEPSAGAVLLDGIAAAQYDARALRRQVGYVPQDVVLFHGDIRENILLGAVDLSDDDLRKVLALSGLDEVLAQLPEGLATQVGERGERLSGGQRQLVGLARALVRAPKLLLLDEPSSMMDPATEQQFIARMKSALPGTTVVLVTHRMAMLKMVERVLVFDRGRIVMDGPVEQVLRRLANPAAGAEAA
ncbi:MAG: type I secretion system permease/ATPase [Rhodocyclaceae bacterium]|nr:type I secretion system permease/ATPase [Rhodocyclaceae bacterium]